MGTFSPSWAHLPFQGHSFPFMGTSSPACAHLFSWAHLLLHRHIFGASPAGTKMHFLHIGLLGGVLGLFWALICWGLAFVLGAPWPAEARFPPGPPETFQGPSLSVKALGTTTTTTTTTTIPRPKPLGESPWNNNNNHNNNNHNNNNNNNSNSNNQQQQSTTNNNKNKNKNNKEKGKNGQRQKEV